MPDARQRLTTESRPLIQFRRLCWFVDIRMQNIVHHFIPRLLSTIAPTNITIDFLVPTGCQSRWAHGCWTSHNPISSMLELWIVPPVCLPNRIDLLTTTPVCAKTRRSSLTLSSLWSQHLTQL
uniref:Uncharacterized protein n=1 Tax=Hyaloperonospora arabidopsidis (strain Emoy2) TaxID=559515 RepID=M4BK03_HYAAE